MSRIGLNYGKPEGYHLRASLAQLGWSCVDEMLPQIKEAVHKHRSCRATVAVPVHKSGWTWIVVTRTTKGFLYVVVVTNTNNGSKALVLADQMAKFI